MVVTSSLGKLMMDQILRYYQIALNINDIAVIHIGKYI